MSIHRGRSGPPGRQSAGCWHHYRRPVFNLGEPLDLSLARYGEVPGATRCELSPDDFNNSPMPTVFQQFRSVGRTFKICALLEISVLIGGMALLLFSWLIDASNWQLSSRLLLRAAVGWPPNAWAAAGWHHTSNRQAGAHVRAPCATTGPSCRHGGTVLQ